ncbi:hypothetical protein DES47_1103 [Roseateles toxinivorans]|uniref:Uncharacterized protein n=1 Tax=Roseateles toxinivorans TaxID=270368 RepID=A0A4R6QGU7_9BURK|nr:hypothetical protein DES47_1103 [Roseateles toxinivorans]
MGRAVLLGSASREHFRRGIRIHVGEAHQCALTIPSRGQTTAVQVWAFCLGWCRRRLPLMSNVRPQKCPPSPSLRFTGSRERLRQARVQPHCSRRLRRCAALVSVSSSARAAQRRRQQHNRLSFPTSHSKSCSLKVRICEMLEGSPSWSLASRWGFGPVDLKTRHMHLPFKLAALRLTRGTASSFSSQVRDLIHWPAHPLKSRLCLLHWCSSFSLVRLSFARPALFAGRIPCWLPTFHTWSGTSVRPNPAFEPTRAGWSLQAPISFWAFCALPSLAAQLER